MKEGEEQELLEQYNNDEHMSVIFLKIQYIWQL